jgi:ANTAR domain
MRDPTQAAAEARLNRLLSSITETANDVLGFDAVTVSTRHAGTVSTMIATDQRLVALDDAQYESKEGPCLEVLDPHDPIPVRRMHDEQRWPHFVETAKYLGVETSLSLHVPVGGAEDVAASMNFYARRPLEVTDHLVNSGMSYAAQVADAMVVDRAFRATAMLADGLAEAMKSRAAIEQAKGILVAEHHVDPEEAFAMLVRVSQRSNTKLRDVARRIVEDRSRRTPDRRDADGVQGGSPPPVREI